jgi:hypothetical protein
MGGSLTIQADFEMDRDPQNLLVGFQVEDSHGQPVINFSPTVQCPDLLLKAKRSGSLECRIPWINLTDGQYYINLFSKDDQGDLDQIDRAAQFHVVPSDVFGTGRPPSRVHGLTFLDSTWTADI